MNVKLLRKVQRHILAEPKRVHMGKWRVKLCTRAGNWLTRYVGATKYTAKTVPPCGTVGCIAGWADMLATPRSKDEHNIENTAGAKLGITHEMGRRLFFVMNWPQDLLDEYYNGPKIGTKAYAALVAKRIDRFIESEGRE